MNLDGVHGCGGERVVRPILWVPVEQDVDGVEVVAARHGRALKAEVVGQLVDEEERSLVAIAAEQYRTVLELRAPQKRFRFARQEGAVDDREEGKLDDPSRDPLLVDDERRGLVAEAGGHVGHVGRARTVKVVEGEFQRSSLCLRLAGGRPRHVRRSALNDRSMKLHITPHTTVGS